MENDIRNSLKYLRGEESFFTQPILSGIGCDATNQEAVDKIFRIKKTER